MTKTRQWAIFTAVAVVVVFVAGWLLLVKPQRSHASNLRTEAATQQAANQDLVSKIASLKSEKRNLPRQEQMLRKFTTQVPDNAAEPTLIRQLSAVAAGAGVDLVTVTPGSASVVTASAATTAGATSLTATASTAGQLVELPLALNVTGSYANIESFFLDLEKLPRSLIVGSWNLAPGGPSDSSTSSSTSSDSGGTLGTPLSGTINGSVFYSPTTTATVSPTTTLPTTAATAPATTDSTTPAPTDSSATTPATTPATPAS